MQLPDFIAAILIWIKNGYYSRTNRHDQVHPEQNFVVAGSESVMSIPYEIGNSANKTLDEYSARFDEKLDALRQELEELKRGSEHRNQ